MDLLMVAFLTLVIIYAISAFSSRRALPPGPRGLPLIGNALQMPTTNEWVVFSQWSKKYGEIMHFSVLGKSIVVLSSREVVSELFEKRGSIYADRPHIPLACGMIGYSRITVLSPYGPLVKESRKLISNTINPRNASELQRIQEAKVQRLLPRLLASPDDFCSHLRWFVASVVFEITHGHDVRDINDSMVQLAETANADFSNAVVPGKFLVDSFPLLRFVPDWFPGAGFKLFAKEARETMDRLLDEPYQYVGEQVKRGTATPSFTSKLIECSPNPTPEEVFMHKMCSTQFYAAGADTTVSSLESLTLILALYPEVQRKAQAEIDALLGTSRLPSFSDRPDLPYVAGLVKEVHRWKPVLPLAVPHKVMQDDTYAGYHIPAGATVVANSWAILHDPAIYPDPFEVKPERYLDAKMDGDMNPDPGNFAFGYGRRVCSGQLLADDTIFITAATILAMFNVSDARTLDGAPFRKDVENIGGSITHAPAFTCKITPRSNDLAKFISTLESSQEA